MTSTEFHSDNHRRLNILAGVWDTTITMMGADCAEGVSSKATDGVIGVSARARMRAAAPVEM